MVHCSVKGCKSDSLRKVPGLSFHSFPDNDIICRKWIEATGRTNWTVKKTSKICSRHFEQNLLIIKEKLTVLYPNAVPTKKSLNKNVARTDSGTIDFEELIDRTKIVNLPREFDVTAAALNVSNERSFDNSYILNRNDILEEANKISEESSNIADKILSIEVKNCAGFYPKYVATPYEIKIQAVFEQWNKWQKLIDIEYKSSPLFYKCYICKKSWWYFYDFREHLTEHKNFILDIEKYTLYEANIVSYWNVSDIAEVKNFNTEGDCPKCGAEFVVHRLSNRIKSCYYSCKFDCCNRTFPTCSALRRHEHSSHTVNFSSKQWEKACEVCLAVFMWDDYHKHMKLMHSVRSDEVVTYEYDKCLCCNANYVCEEMHTCLRKAIAQKYCKYCFRVLLNGSKHFDKNLGFICEICTTVLKKHCMAAEHLMTHTNKFVLVKKCIWCEDFYVCLDDVAASNHIIKEHHKVESVNFFYSIIIPTSCLKGYVYKEKEPVANVTITEEPADTRLEAEIKIKQGNDDNCVSSTGVDNPQVKQIKEEFIYEEDSNEQENYTFLVESNYDDEAENIFGIKIEHGVKEESEPDYEDDIIKLDFCHTDSMPDIQQGSLQDLQDSVQLLQDSLQENSDKFKTPKTKSRNNNKEPKLYRCGDCGFKGLYRDFKEHNRRHWPDFNNRTFKCTKCHLTFNSLQTYGVHFTEHDLEFMSCPECFKALTHEILLPHITKHIKNTYRIVRLITITDKSPVYKCQICLENVNKTDLFEHWEQHLTLTRVKETKQKNRDPAQSVNPGSVDEEVLQELLRRLQGSDTRKGSCQDCVICHRQFVNRRNDLKRHLIEHLLADALSKFCKYDAIKCQICEKEFKENDNYKKHMRDHACLPIYQCLFCDKSFSNSSNFAKHKKMHNTNAFTCDTCGKKFQAKSSIEKHMKLHETIKPIICEPCGQEFHGPAFFKKHLRSTHASSPKKFRCMICMQVFNSGKEKLEHEWLVHKQRAQKNDCPICEKSYRKYTDLRLHVKEEHGSKLQRRVTHSRKKL